MIFTRAKFPDVLSSSCREQQGTACQSHLLRWCSGGRLDALATAARTSTMPAALPRREARGCRCRYDARSREEPRPEPPPFPFPLHWHMAMYRGAARPATTKSRRGEPATAGSCAGVSGAEGAGGSEAAALAGAEAADGVGGDGGEAGVGDG